MVPYDEYYVTFVMTIYGNVFGEPNSSTHEVSGEFISLIKPMCFGLGFHEA